MPDLLPNEREVWPSLGPLVVAFIEACLVFGPGDLRGQPAKVDAEKQALLYRMYEVYPPGARDANGKPLEGRRRFRRCALSLQKGSAKTEFAAWIAAAELHPDGPVRCVGFSGARPLPGPVTDPYIPLVAYTEEQTEDLAYAALKTILELSPVAGDFDIGLERVQRRVGGGKAVALAAAPDARDGARTTFAHKDETHRWTLDRLRRAHTTMIANLPKRLLADPWELETTTAYSPGERSVAEDTHDYAKAIAAGKFRDPRLFFFHRQAADGYDLDDPAQLRAAVEDAAGPTAPWRDIAGICDQWQDPAADRAYLERVYLNRPVAVANVAFDAARWRELATDYRAEDGALIVLGFDGSRYVDATALVAVEVETGHMWPLGVWEHPIGVDEWEVPIDEVEGVVRDAFERWRVWRMYADPAYWEGPLSGWANQYGERTVVMWPTSALRKIAVAIRAFGTAIAAGEVTHDGDAALARHIGNAVRNTLNIRDDDDVPLYTIQKDRRGSPNKIDGAMAAVLAWQARLDALKAGAAVEADGPVAWFPGVGAIGGKG